MKKILIDTDIGGDVDDALALAMALNSSELDIVAITNVYLANAWRAGVTHRILQTWGWTTGFRWRPVRRNLWSAGGATTIIPGRWTASGPSGEKNCPVRQM